MPILSLVLVCCISMTDSNYIMIRGYNPGIPMCLLRDCFSNPESRLAIPGFPSQSRDPEIFVLCLSYSMFQQ